MIEYVSSWFTPTILFCFLNLMIGTIFISSSLKPHQKKQQHQLGDDNSVPQLARVPSLLERVRSFNYSLRQDHSASDPFSHAQNTYPFSRAPSLLERLGAVNTSFSRSEHPGDFPATTQDADPPENGAHNSAPLFRSPSFLERVRSINFSLSRSEQPDPFPSTTHHTAAQTRKVEVEENSETVMSDARRTKSATLAEIPAFSKKKMKKSASEKMEVDPGETEEEVYQRRPATVREKNTAKFEEEDDAVDEKADDFINRFKQQLKLQRLNSLIRYKETLHKRVGN